MMSDIWYVSNDHLVRTKPALGTDPEKMMFKAALNPKVLFDALFLREKVNAVAVARR